MLGLKIQFTAVSNWIGDQSRLHEYEGLSGPAPAPFHYRNAQMSFKIPFVQTGSPRMQGMMGKITLFLSTNSGDNSTQGCMCVVTIYLLIVNSTERQTSWVTRSDIVTAQHQVWSQDIENADFHLNNADM